MALSTSNFRRCISTLEASLEKLERADIDSVDYEVFRNAVVKGFELALETGGKLLRRALKEFEMSPRTVEELAFKDVFRQAARHGLMTVEQVGRWFKYRDNRNSTAHDYGVGFAEETLLLLPQFALDARGLEAVLMEKFGDGSD